MNPENIKSEASNSDDISLKDLLLKIKEWGQYLLSKWLIIVLFGLIGGGIGFAYAYSKKPQYIAATTFVLEDGGSSSGGLGGLGGLASMAGIDIGGGGGGIFQGDNILELYKSRKMIEKTLLTEVDYKGKKELLIDLYINFNDFRKSWAESPELKDIEFRGSSSFNRLQDSIMGSAVSDINNNYLKVEKPSKKLSIIRAEVRSPDEFFSKYFNEAIVKNVNDFYVQTKTKRSSDNVKIIQRQADSVRSVMNGAIYTAAVITDATPNLNPTRQVQRMAPIQKSQFSAEANKAVLTEMVKNLELSKMSLLKETPLIQVIDYPIFPLTKDKFGKLKGLIIGGILGGFVVCLLLIIRKAFKEILG